MALIFADFLISKKCICHVGDNIIHWKEMFNIRAILKQSLMSQCSLDLPIL